MADTEVEKTLREIRERVRAEAQPIKRAPHAHVAAAEVSPNDGAKILPASDALARLEANLATAERTWSRLPPLVSYRKGLAARIELWLKRQIKRATHWYTWEQVNFNAAVYHALRDAHTAIAACQQQLSQMESALNSEVLSLRSEAASLQKNLAELETRLASSVASMAASVDSLRAEHTALRSAHESLRSEHTALDTERAALRTEHTALRTEHEALRTEHEALRTEMRDRVEHALEEQRVSFKQLSLEASERAVMHDRARRNIEARLAEISKAVNRKS